MTADAGSDRRAATVGEGSVGLLIRKLPRSTTSEALKAMLLFSQGFQDAELVAAEYAEDTGFATALVRFSSLAGAREAQSLLDGKPNTAGQANMIVELAAATTTAPGGGRRGTLETAAARASFQALSPPPAPLPKSSRFNGTFQSIEKLSPQSPHPLPDGARMSGKSVISEDDAADDDTGHLIQDPRGYMKKDAPGFLGPRAPGAHRAPVGAFSALSLNTNMTTTPPPPAFTSPRSALHAGTPTSTFSPGGTQYPGSGNHYLRHNYPPVNPADQNPPCNTLYVGNLPMDTSEDELKAMFSKQRGYKRLCFRTKQNGPMCFVEFEDISFATKTLNELYGAQLHNSVKGGIRLSFSKNPLGVRSGQPGSTHPTSPLSPGAVMMNGLPPMSPAGFSTANGPPPGLAAPPGLHASTAMSPTLTHGPLTPGTFPLGMSPLPGGRGMALGNGIHGAPGPGYPDYMMGR